MITGKPLTPIEDTEDVWNEVHGRKDASKHYQCKRMSSLFKDVKPTELLSIQTWIVFMESILPIRIIAITAA